MKTNINSTNPASTYALLVRSQQEERSLSETLVYTLLIGSAAVAMWLTAHQPFHIPVAVVGPTASIAQTAGVAQLQRV